jgi:hypothetical protein
MFESLKPQLIIEHHGRTTVARIGKTYGVARCNPDDKYDAMTGDILAVQRLYAKKAPKKKIVFHYDHGYFPMSKVVFE